MAPTGPSKKPLISGDIKSNPGPVAHGTCTHAILKNPSILGFHSRDQQPCFSTKTKEHVSIIIAFNSRRIGSGHQHGRHFIVWGHQHGGRDVM